MEFLFRVSSFGQRLIVRKNFVVDMNKMKHLFVIAFVMLSYQAISQKLISRNKFKVTIEARDLTLSEAFRLLHNVTPVTNFYCEFYVIKEGKKYMRSYLTFMRKNQAYLIEKGKRWKKVSI
jgi:hypothetical protein